MAGAELRPIPKSLTILSNRTCLTLSGMLGGFGEGFMLPLVIVSAYVLHMTSNLLVIGAVPALAFGVRPIGTLIASWLLGTSKRRKPWVFSAHLIRAGAAGLIAWIAWQEGVDSSDRLRTFLITYGVFAFFSGFASFSANSLARMALAQENRNRIFDLRTILAAAAGVVAGATIHELFNDGGQSLSRSFSLLFIAAAVSFAASAFFVLLVREASGQLPRNAPSPGGTTAHGRSMQTFRRFVLVRMLVAAAATADVFLIVFAVLELGMQADFLGYCAIAFSAGLLGGLLLWRLLRESILARSVLQVGTVLRIAPPLIAVMIPYLQESAYYQEHTSTNAVPHWLIVAAFATLGCSAASIGIGGYAFVTSISTSMTPWFASVTTAILAPVSLLGIGAGWVARNWGFDILFAVALALSLVALLACGLLPVTAIRQPQTGAGVATPAPGHLNTSRFLIR
ncbi:MAG: hypothetical protein KF883_06845 [Thermomicrobiales bacterium]|nr:hypothetical protein [Thermomicrobiales bacterium]